MRLQFPENLQLQQSVKLQPLREAWNKESGFLFNFVPFFRESNT
jgi:hypothetical protein